jgi:hypothetical protein
LIIKKLEYFKQEKNVVATFYNKTFNIYTSRDLRLTTKDLVKEIYDNIKYHTQKENLWND